MENNFGFIIFIIVHRGAAWISVKKENWEMGGRRMGIGGYCGGTEDFKGD